jgi:hypothetical protein
LGTTTAESESSIVIMVRLIVGVAGVEMVLPAGVEGELTGAGSVVVFSERAEDGDDEPSDGGTEMAVAALSSPPHGLLALPSTLSPTSPMPWPSQL